MRYNAHARYIRDMAANINVVTEEGQSVTSLAVDLAADTVAGVIERLAERVDRLAAGARLSLGGRLLVDAETLAACGLVDGSEVTLSPNDRAEETGEEEETLEAEPGEETVEAEPGEDGVAEGAPRAETATVEEMNAGGEEMTGGEVGEERVTPEGEEIDAGEEEVMGGVEGEERVAPGGEEAGLEGEEEMNAEVVDRGEGEVEEEEVTQEAGGEMEVEVEEAEAEEVVVLEEGEERVAPEEERVAPEGAANDGEADETEELMGEPQAAEGDEIAVCVLHPRGDPFTLYLSAAATVLFLKERLGAEHGYGGGQLLRLTCGGLTPGDDRLLGELQQANMEAGLMVEVVASIQLSLNLYTGTVVPITVPSDALIQVLCQSAHRHGTVPYHLQRVLYADRRLELGHRLSEYGVRDGSQVLVELSDYEVMVFFKTLTGETIMLRVSPRDTVADVKRKIEAQENIPAEAQRLIFIGQQMDDRRRLLDYRVEHENAIHIVLRQGNTFQVFIDVYPDRTHILEMEPTDLVSAIKEHLEEREGMLVRFQELYLGDTLLRDNATLQESGVGANAILRFSREEGRDTQIFIGVPRNDRFSVWVKPEDTVRFVKEMVALREGVPIEKQELFFARRKLDDNRTLQSYYIEANHMIHMEVIAPRVLHVTAHTPDGQEVHADIAEDRTVADLKAYLGGGDESGTEQQLFLAGSELEDARLLSDCDLTVDCSLDLVATPLGRARLACGPVPIILFIKTLSGQTLSLTVAPTDTVRDLKAQIQDKQGILESLQCLVAAGRQLNDSLTISECGVQNQSVLHLVLHVPREELIHLVVEADGGRSFTLDVARGGTVDDLLSRIGELEGGGAEGHRVVYEGRLLENVQATLNSYGIADGSTLQLQNA